MANGRESSLNNPTVISKFQLLVHKRFSKVIDILTKKNINIDFSKLNDTSLEQFYIELRTNHLYETYNQDEIKYLKQYFVLREIQNALKENNLLKARQIYQDHHRIFHSHKPSLAVKVVGAGAMLSPLGVVAVASYTQRQKKKPEEKFANQVEKLLKDNKKEINNNINITDTKNAKYIQNGDELRNINSYEYLKNIYEMMKENIFLETTFISQHFNSLRKLNDIFSSSNENYDPNFAYGDFYTKFLLEFEKELLQKEVVKIRNERTDLVKSYYANLKNNDFNKAAEDKQKISGHKYNEIDSIAEVIYKNKNQALDRTYGMIQSTLHNDVVHTKHAFEKNVTNRLRGSRADRWNQEKGKSFSFKKMILKTLNKITPEREGSPLYTLISVLSSTFKPQTTTSMASEMNFAYRKDRGLPQELRMGTQGQRNAHSVLSSPLYYDVRNSPTFEAYLEAQLVKQALNEKNNNSNNPNVKKRVITHVYINHMGLDRNDLVAGPREVELTNKLHELQNKYPNVAVITLPADKGLLEHARILSHSEGMSLAELKNKVLRIAQGAPEEKIKDFRMSDDIKEMVYGSLDNEKAVLETLFDKSVRELGFEKKDPLTEAEVTALYFHFMKFEMTNLILEQLSPETFNISCKDAIDRARVSSTYYNLVKSIKEGNPLSQEEFEQSLYAAAALVKGRGINFHSQLFWNSIDAYVENHKGVTKDCPTWLVEWRDNNIPEGTKRFYAHQLEAFNNAQTPFGMFANDHQRDAAQGLINCMNTPGKNLTEGQIITITNHEKLKQIYTELQDKKLISVGPIPTHKLETPSV